MCSEQKLAVSVMDCSRCALLHLCHLQSPAVRTLEAQLTSAEHENISLRAQLLKQQALLEKHGLMNMA
jgi:hypothetical protein